VTDSQRILVFTKKKDYFVVNPSKKHYLCTHKFKQGDVAQLARALEWHSRGRRFESDLLHKIPLLAGFFYGPNMENLRLVQLLSFYEEDPNDPFNVYALALEYQSHDHARAAHFFEELLLHFPQYLPTYYHAADFFAAVDVEKTLAIYEKGIALAQEQQKPKALEELRRAYRSYQDEMEL
jgi:tetratricopeptide (TPR) repeat protein